jgi:hypothetical protein
MTALRIFGTGVVVLLAAATLLPAASAPGAETSTGGTSAQCDSELQSHVYDPTRLIVQQQCIAVTGTIVDATAGENVHRADGVRHEPDGDSHGWLRVDPAFKRLLDSGNMTDEKGNLVFEIICRYPITQGDAKKACQGYEDHVQLPPVGSHVRVVGTYVHDNEHGWNEIHPVTSITVVP